MPIGGQKRMRDPKRLDEFYDRLKELHKEKIPDWRFGQFCSNFFTWLMTVKKKDLFFPEEKQMLEYIEEYLKEIKGC